MMNNLEPMTKDELIDRLNQLPLEDIVKEMGAVKCTMDRRSVGSRYINLFADLRDGVRILVSLEPGKIPHRFVEYNYQDSAHQVEIREGSTIAELADMGAEFFFESYE